MTVLGRAARIHAPGGSPNGLLARAVAVARVGAGIRRNAAAGEKIAHGLD